MKLILFDCDNTLWKIPYEENDEFMSSLESVDNFDFELHTPVVDQYFKAKSRGYIIGCLTNRHINVQKSIIEKLKKYDIIFDYLLFRRENRSKAERLKTLLKIIKDKENITEVHFWDDKIKHIEDVKTLGEIFTDITFYLHLVPQTKEMEKFVRKNEN